MRSRYKISEQDGIYFITSTIVEWIPVFISEHYFQLLINSWTHCQTHKNLKIYAYVILENHFHMIISGSNLSRTIQSFKQYTAKQIIHLAERQGKTWLLNLFEFSKKGYKTESKYQLWQEGFHPELLFNDKILIQKIDYIHYNPVKKGYVDKPECWKYSSARNFIYNDRSVIKLDSLPTLII